MIINDYRASVSLLSSYSVLCCLIYRPIEENNLKTRGACSCFLPVEKMHFLIDVGYKFKRLFTVFPLHCR